MTTQFTQSEQHELLVKNSDGVNMMVAQKLAAKLLQAPVFVDIAHDDTLIEFDSTTPVEKIVQSLVTLDAIPGSTVYVRVQGQNPREIYQLIVEAFTGDGKFVAVPSEPSAFEADDLSLSQNTI